MNAVLGLLLDAPAYQRFFSSTRVSSWSESTVKTNRLCS